MSLIIDIKVVPSSGKQKFVLDKAGSVKCFLKNPPEGGKANDELIKLIARALGITRDNISILLGATSRRKRIQIKQDISYEEFLSILGIEQQTSI